MWLRARLCNSLSSSTASPCTTASMSVVNRRTPRAITARPPISIQGTPMESSERRSASSASSRRRSPRPRRLRTTLNAGPTPPHVQDCLFANRIPRPRPGSCLVQQIQRRQALGNRPRRLRALCCSQLRLSRCSSRVALEQSANGLLLGSHASSLYHRGDMEPCRTPIVPGSRRAASRTCRCQRTICRATSRHRSRHLSSHDRARERVTSGVAIFDVDTDALGFYA